MDHKVRIPAHLSDPGITDGQLWGFFVASVFVGSLVACFTDAYVGLVAAWATQIAWAIGLCVHRHSALRAAYHAQRRRGR